MANSRSFTTHLTMYDGNVIAGASGWTDDGKVLLNFDAPGAMSGPIIHMTAAEARALAGALLDAANYARPIVATAADLGLEAA